MKVMLKFFVWMVALWTIWRAVAWDAGWIGLRTGEYYRVMGDVGDIGQWWNLVAFFVILPAVYAGTIYLCGLIDRCLETRPDMSRVHYLR